MTLVPYFPLSDAIIRQIVDLQLERIRRRVGIAIAPLSYDESGRGNHRGSLQRE